MRKIPVAVDLFSGCGGVTRGLKDAGFKVAAAVEIDGKAQATYVLNHSDVRLYRSDIRKLSPDDLLNDCGLKIGELDLLAGCPPCQGFSRLRTRNKTKAVDDDRNDLVADFLRFVLRMLPKTVMLENVPALAGDERFQDFRRELEKNGYKTVVDVLNAADYSVPQRRRRLIMLASRLHEPIIAPKSDSRVTVRHAIGDLENPDHSSDQLHAFPENRSRQVKEIIARIPKDGGSRADLGEEFQLDCHKRSDGFRDVYGRMAWDEVAPTITGGCHAPSKGRFLHPFYDRTITLREAALLQGFPQNYEFDVSHGKEAIALMIGNALPPPFIAAQARVLRSALDKT